MAEQEAWRGDSWGGAGGATVSAHWRPAVGDTEARCEVRASSHTLQLPPAGAAQLKTLMGGVSTVRITCLFADLLSCLHPLAPTAG